jgi:DNA modification methylase
MHQSFEVNGCVQPILCNSAPSRKNVVINGHLRLQTAIDLGYTEVPVIFVEVPYIEDEKRLNLTLNRISGDWDFEKLKTFDLNILLASGFDDADLSHIWDDNASVDNDDFKEDQELGKITEPKTKPGQMFKLGSHFLICGDSQDPDVVKRLVGSYHMDMIYTDSPYNIGLSYDSGVGRTRRYGGVKTDDNKSDAEFKQFLKTSMENGLAVCKPDCHIFYYCDEKYVWLLQTLYQELGVDNKRLCFWLKNNATPTPQVAFSKVIECCCYATRGAPYLNDKVANLTEILNREVGSGNRLPDDVMDLLQIWLVRRLSVTEMEHPTSKPPTLHEKALRRCSKPGNCILDLFSGSGSLMVACEALKRRAFMAEWEPKFCDLIINRYEKLTNDHATLLN